MKSLILKTCLLFSFLFTFQMMTSQTGIINGTMRDSSGEPLPGVSVIVKGTVNATITDSNGEYSIECSAGDILVFTYIGMKTQERKITSEMFKNDIKNETNIQNRGIYKSNI